MPSYKTKPNKKKITCVSSFSSFFFVKFLARQVPPKCCEAKVKRIQRYSDCLLIERQLLQVSGHFCDSTTGLSLLYDPNRVPGVLRDSHKTVAQQTIRKIAFSR